MSRFVVLTGNLGTGTSLSDLGVNDHVRFRLRMSDYPENGQTGLFDVCCFKKKVWSLDKSGIAVSAFK
jgi:hypothetical protein